MNRKQYLEAIARESASLTALVQAGDKTPLPTFDGSLATDGSVRGQAASLLDAVTRHQTLCVAASLSNLSGAWASNQASLPVADSADERPGDVIDVQAIELPHSDKPQPEQ